MTLDGYTDELNGYNTVIKNGQLPDANDIKAVVPPIGGIIAWVKTFDSADSGTTDGTTSNKLIESGQNFGVTITVGMIVNNTTDDTFAYVTAVDSNTILSISADIMVSGEDYTIYTTPYLSDAWAECNGQALSDADSPYNGAALPDLNGVIQVRATATSTSDTTLTDTGIGWNVNEWDGFIVEITNGAGAGQSREIASNTSQVLTFSDTGDWSTAIGSTPTYIIRSSDKILIGSYKSGASGLGGNAWHRLTEDEMPSHTHVLNISPSGGTSGNPACTSLHSANITSAARGGSDIFDNRPPWYKMVWIMRVK